MKISADLHNRSARRFFSRRDLIAAGVVLLLAAAALLIRPMLAGNAAAEAEIYCNAKLVRTVALRPGVSETFAVPGQPNVVLQTENGRIRFYSSTCPDKICIRAGWLSRPGESAACLPNRVLVRIAAAGKGSSSGAADTYIS